LSPSPAEGQRVSFVATSVRTDHRARWVDALTGWSVDGTASLDELIEDVSLRTDLVSQVVDYESELVTLSGSITGYFTSAAAGHVAADVSTAGVMSDPWFR